MNPVTKSQWSKPLKTIRGVNHLLKKSSGVNHSNPGLILTRHQIPCSVKRAGATMDSDPMCRIFSLKCNKITTRGDNLFKITGFDPHPSSDIMLRQKSRRHHGFGSYVPHLLIISKYDSFPNMIHFRYRRYRTVLHFRLLKSINELIL